MSDEMITSKSLLPIDLKRTEEKPNLILKFRKVFTYPICLGILVNIVVTIIFLLKFSTNLINIQDLTDIVHNAEKERNKPIIENVGNIIYKKFQPSIYTLNSFKKYIRHITNEDFLDLKDKSLASKTAQGKSDLKAHMINFIKKHSMNAKDLYNNYESYHNRVKNNILDHSIWFLNNTFTSVDSLSENNKEDDFAVLKQIYFVSNLNLLFKSHFELYKNSNFTGITKIYGGFAKTGVYFVYPPYNTSNRNETNYNNFVNFTNPPDCRDETLNIPSYFYFKCRPWFRETVELRKTNNFNITITYPYAFVSKNLNIGISSCIQILNSDIFGDPNRDPKKDINDEEFLVICVDLPLSDIVSVFDYLNNMINGYFFVLRIESAKPIYYPQLPSKKNLDSLVRYEFDQSTEYYIDDLIRFKRDIKKNLLKKFWLNETDNNFNNNITVERNGSQYTYNVFPVSLNFGDNFYDMNDSKNNLDIINMLNIVYVTEKNLHNEAIYGVKRSLTGKIIFSIIIIVILGFIVLLITFYLINSIATNILRPIKMMNSILAGIDKDKKDSEDQDFTDLKKAKIKSSTLDNNISNSNIKNNEEENEFENEDDDLLDIRSEDIDNLFQTLIDLKKTLQYVQVNPNNENEYKFLNLLFAKSTLNYVHNIQARLLCNSNLGNLAIKFKKYDKAIVHLWEAVKLNKKHIERENEFFNEYMDDLHKLDYENRYEFDINHLGCFEVEAENEEKTKLTKAHFLELEMENKINIESRIPKLIFAFKKFFKNFNKILKLMLRDPKFEMIIDSLDSFYSKNLKELKSDEIYYLFRDKLIARTLKSDINTKSKFHNFTNFKKVIDQYLGQAMESKNQRLKILAEFELIEFVVKYILIPMEYNLKCTSKIYYNARVSNAGNISETKFNSIIVNLESKIANIRQQVKKKIEETTNIIKKDNKDSTEKYLISKKLSKKMYLEYSDLPKSVLLQRINFLNAKFNFNHDLKESFYMLNSITKFQDDVIDGVVLISSYKKMKKIFKFILEKIEDLPNNNQFLIKFANNINLNNIVKGIGNDPNRNSLDELTKINLNLNNNNNNPIINLNNLNIESLKLIKDASEEFVRNIREKAELCVRAYDDEIAKYSLTNKDIAVLLDYSDSFAEKEKKGKAQKFFEYIFENICTFNDRISLFGYNNTVFQLLSLMNKNNKTTKLIENHYQGIWKNNEFYSEKDVPTELVKAIGYVYNNIGRKDIYNKREKWIIVLTDAISENDLKVLKNKKQFLENVYGSKKNENLIIVRLKHGENKDEIAILQEALNFNKSCYIDIEKKHLIKSRMRVEGVINETSIFDNEIYNP